MFASLVTGRPDQRGVPRQSTLDLHEVTGLRIGIAGIEVLSPELARMEELGIASFHLSPTPIAELTIDGGRRGRRLEMEHVPLKLVF